MGNLEKDKITTDLRAFIDRVGSANKAATMLEVSSGTISKIVNGEYDNISEAMFRKIQANIQAQSSGRQDWNIVETQNFKMLTAIIADAQENSNVFGVVSPAGSSKTETIKAYCQEHPNAYRLKCGDFWNKKYFCEQLLKVMGRDSNGYTVAEMVEEIVMLLKSQDRPVIVIDEFDKVADPVLYFFITLFNELEDQCGIVVVATDYLEKRILKGVKNNRKGYREIYSRIGGKFIKLPGVSYQDVHAICAANGVENQSDIKAIWNDSEEDLRRVKRKIHAYKKQSNGQTK